jgi:Tfp pilus assembly protein PilF
MFAVALAAAWAAGLAWSRRTATACGVLLVLLGARSTAQALTWRNRVTLYGHAVKVTPHSVVAHNNYGSGLWRSGDAAGAEREFREALRLDPDDAGAQSNLDLVLRARSTPAPRD